MRGSWTATYRLQVHGGFGLDAAAEILPYLGSLGISHAYLSPCLQAAPGSSHGYDVTDPTRVSDTLGGEAAWSRFVAAAREAEIGILLDIVPNHMAASASNPWWDALLANGPFSDHVKTFDIMPRAIAERWRLALPVLGEPYGDALAASKLGVDIGSGLPRLRYYDSSWPLGPFSWHHVAGAADKRLAAMLTELAFLRANESPDAGALSRYAELSREAEERFRTAAADPATRKTFDARAAALGRDPDLLHAVIEDQFFRLCWWKLEGEIVNYRRFFNIGELVGVRVEEEAVFDATHERIERMARAGEIDGLRIDHPDGLHDPKQYFERLRALLPDGRIFAEKILEAEEHLPDDWPVDGTTGYDFLSRVNRLWIDDHKADAFTAAYADFTGHSVNYPALVREKKLEIIEQHFCADLERLATLALHIAQSRWETCDLSRIRLRGAIKVLTSALPVYRTYLTSDTTPAGEVDSKVVTDAVVAARAQADAADGPAFDFLESLLTRRLAGTIEDAFVARWQQLAPGVMAKGAEDTTFYCFDRLVSCNEVGSSPSLFGISTDNFHQFCSHLNARWPHAMLATSTHDTKRSEDVRARISTLTEVPERWTSALHRWSELNTPHWRGREPDRHAEYLFYQTVIGAWPISEERAANYMLKAVREAKIFTSWHEPNETYEVGLREFVAGALGSREFVADLEEFVSPLVLPGRINGLAQTLIKMTAPGTPDFYQGSELWDLSLVDPDNRRPVDFGARREMMARAASTGARDAFAEIESGFAKLWLIAKTLVTRREFPETFGPEAVYQPRSARGARLGHVLAFQRGEEAMVVVPRFTLSLGGDWEDTLIELPVGLWRDVFSGREHSGEVAPEVLFADFPVSLLLRPPGGSEA